MATEKYRLRYSFIKKGTQPELITPAAPVVAYSSATRILSATHSLGGSILYSYRGSAFVPYIGSLLVDDLAHDPQEWRFKRAASTGYNESPVAFSPAIAPYVPSGNRLTNVVIPEDASFQYSRQNPPQPTISTLRTASISNPVAPTDYYGAMFDPAIWVELFDPGQGIVLKEIWLGPYQGDLSSRYYRKYGLLADGSKVLLLEYAPAPGGVGVPEYTPGKGYVYPVAPANYIGIETHVKGNAKPWFERYFGDYTTVPTRQPAPITKYPVKNHLATNVHPPALLHNTNDANEREFIPEDKQALLRIMGGPRVYINVGSYTPAAGDFGYEQDSQGYYVENMYKTLHEICPDFIVALENIPPDLYATYPQDGNTERVPIPFGADQTDPAAWDRAVEFCVQPTYRYGNNKNIPLNLVKSRERQFNPNDPRPDKAYVKRVGLGYWKYLEILLNEGDRYWKLLTSFLTPAGAAVGAGRIYDAIKEWNPDMILSMFGLASFAPDWLAEYARECERLYGRDENGQIRLKCDRLQVHFYPTTGGSQYSNEPTVGVTVEQSYGNALRARFQDFNYHLFGNKPVGIGEAGYDATSRSPIRAVVPAGSGYTQRQWIGILYLRFSQWAAKNGFEYTKFYQWEDREALDQDNQFSAMGMVNVVGTAPNAVLTPWPNLYMLGQWRTITNDGACKHVERLSASPQVDLWRDENGREVYWVEMPTENNSTGTWSKAFPNGATRYDFRFDSFTPTASVWAGSGEVTEKGFAVVPN